MQNISELLFKYGSIRETLKNEHKGSGVYGDELGCGSFAVLDVFEDKYSCPFFIKEEYRGRGIGKWALKEMSRHESLEVCHY